ncbi:MAG TPA: tetratricopeptide repeat protein, partial [Blastocatellia bacterium]
ASRAITEFQTAIEQAEGDYAEAHYNLGISLFGMGKIEAATAEFKDAIDQSENFPEAHYNLAVAFAKMGKNEDAAREFETYLKTAANPRDSDDVRTRIVELRKASLK